MFDAIVQIESRPDRKMPSEEGISSKTYYF